MVKVPHAKGNVEKSYTPVMVTAVGFAAGVEGRTQLVVANAMNTSAIAAELLRENGYEAYSLKEGMKGWSLAWNTAKISFDDFQIIQVRRTGKGCLSYIIESNGAAVVVDASLSPDVYEQI